MRHDAVLLRCLLAAALVAGFAADGAAQRREPGDQRPGISRDDTAPPGAERGRERASPPPDEQPRRRSPRAERRAELDRPREPQMRAPERFRRDPPRAERPSRTPAPRARPDEPVRRAAPRTGDRQIRERPRRETRPSRPPPPWPPMARPRAAPPAVHPDVRRHWRPLERPHYRELRDRHYRHRWYCGPGCRLTFIFAFTLWPRPLAVYEHTDGYWPLFEALEYNATGEPSLWESDWGYVEFTSIATYRSSYPVRIAGRFEERWRWCRDFRRVVVRGDGLVRRYGGTACRHETRRFWRITRSYRIG